MPRKKVPKYKTKRPAKLTLGEKKEVKAIVKRTVRASEPLHYSDEYSTGTDVSTTATFLNLTDAISVGTIGTTRLGDVIKLAKMRLHGTFVRKSGHSLTLDFDHIRMILFKWKPDTAVETPDITKILYNSAVDPYNAPIELDPAERAKFTVLEDRRIIIGGRYSATSPVQVNIPIIKDFSINKFGKSLGRVLYNVGATTGKGHIFLMVLGAQTAGAGSSISYHSTVHFDP